MAACTWYPYDPQGKVLLSPWRLSLALPPVLLYGKLLWGDENNGREPLFGWQGCNLWDQSLCPAEVSLLGVPRLFHVTVTLLPPKWLTIGKRKRGPCLGYMTMLGSWATLKSTQRTDQGPHMVLRLEGELIAVLYPKEKNGYKIGCSLVNCCNRLISYLYKCFNYALEHW